MPVSTQTKVSLRPPGQEFKLATANGYLKTSTLNWNPFHSFDIQMQIRQKWQLMKHYFTAWMDCCPNEMKVSVYFKKKNQQKTKTMKNQTPVILLLKTV